MFYYQELYCSAPPSDSQVWVECHLARTTFSLDRRLLGGDAVETPAGWR